jgi:hypothetical protein
MQDILRSLPAARSSPVKVRGHRDHVESDETDGTIAILRDWVAGAALDDDGCKEVTLKSMS